MNTNTQLTSRPHQAVATVDSVRKFLESPAVQDQLKLACKKHVTPDRMARLVLTAVQKSPKLIECFASEVGKRSVGLAMLTAGQYGLEVDGKMAHLVPYRDNRQNATVCQLIPGFQGLVNLAYNSALVKSIWADAVYENEVFTYKKGLSITLEHEPLMNDEEPGALRAAYAVAELRDGGKVVVVLFKRDIERIRASSRGADQPSSPWQTHPAEMWKKSAIRQLCKIIPQSSELRDVLRVEDDFNERGPSAFIDVQAQPETRFLPKAATHPTDSPAQAMPEAVAMDSDSVAPATTSEPPVVEPTIQLKVGAYFDDLNIGFDTVMTTLRQVAEARWKDCKATQWSELTDKDAADIWKGRIGTGRLAKQAA
jgi:recombination protein RecT